MTAVWDQDAEVFTTVSDIPGLVVEAGTREEGVDLVRSPAPEVIAANVPAAMPPHAFEIVTFHELAGGHVCSAQPGDQYEIANHMNDEKSSGARKGLTLIVYHSEHAIISSIRKFRAPRYVPSPN